MNIKTLGQLLSTVIEQNKQSNNMLTVKLTEGVSKVTHGLFIVVHPNKGVVVEHYGIKNLLDVVIETPEYVEEPFEIKFIGLTAKQLECCEFYVEFEKEVVVEEGESELIKSSMVLNTPAGGEREICGEDCDTTKGCGNEHNSEDCHKETLSEGIVSEESSEESSETKVVVETKETEDLDSKPDFNHAESLYNNDDKPASKVALEEYARSFNVELQRNKKFENMMVDFKAAFEG